MIELIENVDLSNYSLIVPSVSVGNVGQLTADLLIYTLRLTKLGYVWHSAIVPLAGPDPFGESNSMSTACELYFSEDLKIIVLQIRSSFLNTKRDFLKRLCLWVKEQNLKQLVILTGSFAHERRDKQLIGDPLRYVLCSNIKEQKSKTLIPEHWIELESKGSTCTSQQLNKCDIPGSGITHALYQTCLEGKIPCVILVEFCSDGNNAPDAVQLADYLDNWLQLKVKAGKTCWIPPPSWTLLFGSMAPVEIFN